MVHWVLGLSTLYVAVLGLLMVMGDQSVSAPFFWITTLAASLTAAYGVAARVLRTENALSWKLQRVSGAFLLLMIPAHLLFMHLSPAAGKEAELVIARMQNTFVKIVDFGLVLAVLYHAVYGLFSLGQDYLAGRALRRVGVVLLALVTFIFAFQGVRLILSF
jgi:succinate dehydrogenase hydrophobic membrane anchor protein